MTVGAGLVAGIQSLGWMPWIQTEPERKRRKFVQAALRREVPMSELCQRFGISRKSGDKMLQRHAEVGLPGLRDASRAPKPPGAPDTIECETCTWCLPDVSPCDLVDCILDAAAGYPLEKVQPGDMPKQGETLLQLLFYEPTAYKPGGPNSNMFVGQVAKQCRMTIPKDIVSRKPMSLALGLNMDITRYLEEREEWLSGR